MVLFLTAEWVPPLVKLFCPFPLNPFYYNPKHFFYFNKRGTCKKSINRPRTIKSRPGVRVEPLEFTSSGGRGKALFRLVKSRFLTFYEVVNKRALIYRFQGPRRSHKGHGQDNNSFDPFRNQGGNNAKQTKTIKKVVSEWKYLVSSPEYLFFHNSRLHGTGPNEKVFIRQGEKDRSRGKKETKSGPKTSIWRNLPNPDASRSKIPGPPS